MNKLKKNIPAMIIFFWSAIIIICPLIYVFVISFMKRSPTSGIEFALTTANYSRLFDATYINIYLASIGTAFFTTLFTLLIGYPFGYFLARSQKKYKLFLILLVMVPFWTNSLLRLFGWKILLQSGGIIDSFLTWIGMGGNGQTLQLIKPDGAINSFLIWIGLISEKNPLTLTGEYISVLTVTVYMLLPFMILPIYNSVDKMDKTVLEASKDLGAGRLATFRRITLPLTAPGIASGALLVFIPAVGMFFISDVIGGGKTMLLGNLIQNQFTSSRNWPFGSALSVIMIMGVLIFVFILLRASKDNEGGIMNI